jgi:hypothetical protein
MSLVLSIHYSVGGFNIFAGALLGFCAGLLWTAQGTIMLSYPSEQNKGKYFAWFWAIFNMGAVIGGLVSFFSDKTKGDFSDISQIPLGQNFNVKTNTTVNDGTYIAFIILMAAGSLLAIMLCNAKDVIREDGTHIVLMKNPSWASEFYGLYETIKFSPFVLLLFPMFWSSNWFVTYQTNSINGAIFDTRTKALNSILYYTAQIVGAGVWGYSLDTTYFRRTVRAKLALLILFTLTMAIWGGGYAYEKTYTRESVNPDLNPNYVAMDWSDSGYVGVMFLYIFYGFFDSCWQATVYW